MNNEHDAVNVYLLNNKITIPPTFWLFPRLSDYFESSLFQTQNPKWTTSKQPFSKVFLNVLSDVYDILQLMYPELWVV